MQHSSQWRITAARNKAYLNVREQRHRRCSLKNFLLLCGFTSLRKSMCVEIDRPAVTIFNTQTTPNANYRIMRRLWVAARHD